MGESDRALLVLDMTADLVSGTDAVPGAAGIVRYVQGELRYFRERGRPVVFAMTAPDLAEPPAILTELTPRSDERVLFKAAPSAFFDTDLGDVLKAQRVRRLTLVGLETHTSVLLSAADAVARGLQVVVPEPCVCARNVDDHRFALRQIREIWPQWPNSPLAGPEGDPDETGRLRRHNGPDGAG
ncbi:MAG: cysteine hydrolase [Deltaproteobacteria bacterium]|nr:cysteine hydrolase [Deltaproteobacteria bacterium]